MTPDEKRAKAKEKERDKEIEQERERARYQKKLFELLCEIDDICKKHDITYYVYAGSAIGAMRHKGMIPWDDDIDVAMTRSNWEKFRDVVEKEMPSGRDLVYHEKYPGYKFLHKQYKNVDTNLYYPSGVLVDYPLGIFLDIIILDPNNQSKLLDKNREILKVLGELLCTYYVLNPEVSLIKYEFYKFLTKIFGKEKIINYLHNKLTTGSEETSEGYLQRTSMYSVYVEKKFVGEPDTVEIYGRKFPTMTDVYAYLRFAYGDSWMHFPPVIPKNYHEFWYDLDYSHQTFVNDYKMYLSYDPFVKAHVAWKQWYLLAMKAGGLSTVWKTNLIRLAVLRTLQIKNKLKNIDVVDLYNHEKIAELHELLDDYVKWQFSPYLKGNGIVLSVPENVVYVTSMLLILNSMYYDANRLLQMHDSYKEKKWYQKALDAIEASRELSIAFYEEHENWQHIKELVNEYLPKYPHHVDFIAAKCQLLLQNASQKRTNVSRKKVKNANKNKERIFRTVLQICREELNYHDKNAYLFDVMADAYVKLGDLRNGASYYKKAYTITDDGMLQQRIGSKLGKIGVSIDLMSMNNAAIEYKEDVDQSLYLEQVEQYQAALTELLRDFVEICTKENIPYFFGGYLAAAAKELGTFAPECCAAHVVMHPADRKRLIEAVKKHAKPNRILESFENNASYVDFSMRYCDTSNTLLEVYSGGFYKYHGVDLIIYFVRPDEKSVRRRKLSSMFYHAVETNATPRFVNTMHDRSRIISAILGIIMFALLGKKNTKKIAWNIIYRPNNTNPVIKGTMKNYYFQMSPLPVLDFNKFQECSLNGIPLRIPVNYYAFNAWQIKPDWNDGNPVPRLLKGSFIFAPGTDCKELAEELKKNAGKIHYSINYLFSKLLLGIGFRKAGYARYAWRIALRSIDRIKMWKKYMPLKKQIISLYNEKKFDELYDILEEYIEVLRDHIENTSASLAVYFDKDIFRITQAVLTKKGQGGLIKRVLPKIPKAHLEKPLVLPLPEREEANDEKRK